MRVLLVLIAAGLAACSTSAPVRDTTIAQQAFEQRQAALSDLQHWSLVSRLGVNAGDEGGSGRLEWVRSGAEHELQFRGALGRGAWHLSISSDGAVLDQGKAGVVSAPDVDALIYRETGWQLPVRALVWWIQGLPWPAGPQPDQIRLNENGTPARLAQAGWTIEYSRYDESAWELPTRLTASRGEVSVKLAIRQWKWEIAEPRHGEN